MMRAPVRRVSGRRRLPGEPVVSADLHRATFQGRFATASLGWFVLGSFLMAAAPRVLSVGYFANYDEGRWLRRSDVFWQAVSSGDFASASAATVSGSDAGSTMPGVTTMWIGTAARGLWTLGQDIGIVAGGDTHFAASWSALTTAQAVNAVVVSLLMGLIVWFVARWAGRLAAVIAGVLLATEPFLVAHGAVFHTDELLTFLGVASLLLTALALGLPRPTAWCGRPWAGLVAGVLAGAAVLTKLSALALVVGAPILLAWALVSDHRGGGSTETDDATVPVSGGGDASPDAHRLRTVGLWLAGAVGIVVAVYPALWVAPEAEIGHLYDSARLATGGHLQYFLGERTRNPGVLYLFVTLPIRITPWFFLAGLATLALVWRRVTRAYGWLLLSMALPTFAVVSLASKQAVRYALPVLVVGAVAVAIVGAVGFERLRGDESAARGLVAPAGVAVAGGLVLFSLVLAPWAVTYFNPLVGGSRAALHAHTVGSGEGLPEAGRMIASYEAGNCDGLLIWTYRVQLAFPCGRAINSRDPERYRQADYVALYVNQRQREDPALLEDLLSGRELLEKIRIRDVTQVELYGPVAAAAGTT